MTKKRSGLKQPIRFTKYSEREFTSFVHHNKSSERQLKYSEREFTSFVHRFKTSELLLKTTDLLSTGPPKPT